MKRPTGALPFRVEVAESEQVDLADRLRRVRWPLEPRGNEGWQYGTHRGYLERLVRYWREDFDWRAREAELNEFPQYTVQLPGGTGEIQTIHFLYEAGSGPAPTPLVLTHGWPSTYREFLDVVAPLAHPERFGGDPGDAFDVIVPSLPGYGFSSIPREPIGPPQMAELWHRLMTQVLGYSRYAAQAGDWGSLVTSELALRYPEELLGIHLTMLPFRGSPRAPGQAPLSAAEKSWLADQRRWWREESGYRAIQSTKPMTLAYGLMDSPVGLAGWLADKYYRLGDTRKDHAFEGMEERFPFDQILTMISIYWFSGTINSANTLYRAIRSHPTTPLAAGQRVEVPTGYADCPIDDLQRMPRAWGERWYRIEHWSELPRGGHFAAMEEPGLFVEDVRSFFRQLRTAQRATRS